MIRAPRVSCRSPRSPLSSHHHAHDLHTVEDTKAPELTWGAELTQDEVQTFGLLAGVTHPTPPSPRRLRTGRGAWEGREGGGTGGAGHSPLAGGHALFQGLHEGEDPVVPQDHALGQAEVEGLHPHQSGHVGLGVGQQRVQQVRELLPGFVWRAQCRGWAALLARGARLSEGAQKAKALFTLAFRRL